MTPYKNIIVRCQDLELGFPGPMDDFRKLSYSDLEKLERDLDYLKRGEPDLRLRQRYNNAIDIAQRERKRIGDQHDRMYVQALAAEARRTGRETCKCGENHIPGAKYYVSAADAGRTALLSGPYDTHAEALAKVDSVRRRAEERDSGAVFYSFGTVAMPATYTQKGQLD